MKSRIAILILVALAAGRVGDLALIRRRSRLLLDTPMEADDHDLGSSRSRLGGVGHDLHRIDEVHEPGLLGRQPHPVQAPGVRQVHHLHPSHVEYRRDEIGRAS